MRTVAGRSAPWEWSRATWNRLALRERDVRRSWSAAGIALLAVAACGNKSQPSSTPAVDGVGCATSAAAWESTGSLALPAVARGVLWAGDTCPLRSWGDVVAEA